MLAYGMCVLVLAKTLATACTYPVIVVRHWCAATQV